MVITKISSVLTFMIELTLTPPLVTYSIIVVEPASVSGTVVSRILD